MDPNETLKEARKLARAIVDAGDIAAGEALAELFLALDEWLTRGGFPPNAWYGPGAHTSEG